MNKAEIKMDKKVPFIKCNADCSTNCNFRDSNLSQRRGGKQDGVDKIVTHLR